MVEYRISLEVVESNSKGVDAIVTDIENKHNESVKKTEKYTSPVKNQSYRGRELGSELGGGVKSFTD
jgi:hypothetical protein